MHAKIEIEIEEEKDGSLILKYNGMKIGDLNDVNPADELRLVNELIKVREKEMSTSDINKEIEHRLAKLLAWYYTE
ncbi:hypothetical protein AFV1_ORF75 [Captovirus AFV1]|uniref:Uncharacterized protein ORF75 n=1 Tax=Acidianus filamentous virus 1 (isolate United States/Yellowstone) TaxID=654909 RepID=Y075_AFV1Y|nr:hypothetical protein AFV1_ORF75 [Captovirus AFV1]Q70LB1.1 RecName: Full=Uncharacterized protein ORF75 [Acidianus filamentous virus 1 (isolate Yellowstone)]CAD98969.1 hypothetical protein [Captovirus AFV1]